MKEKTFYEKSSKKWGLFFSLSFLFIIAVCAVFADFLVPYSFDESNMSDKLCGFSRDHWLGCDLYGMDLLSQLILGARSSLSLSLSVVFLTTLIGCFVGSLVTLYSRVLDTFFLQLTETMMALPSILVLLCLGSLMELGPTTLILVLAFTGWMGPARLVRAKLLECREFDYVLSGRALGVSSLRLTFRYLLPNLYSPLLVTSIFGISGVVLTEATLSFLGLGPQNMASWGLLIHQGRSVLFEAPNLSVIPGALIFLLILSLNILGDRLKA